MTTKAETYVAVVIQCAHWVAEAHRMAEMALDEKQPSWRRTMARSRATYWAVQADNVSRPVLGFSASELL